MMLQVLIYKDLEMEKQIHLNKQKLKQLQKQPMEVLLQMVLRKLKEQHLALQVVEVQIILHHKNQMEHYLIVLQKNNFILGYI